MLTEKNATIGPSDASTASSTAIAPTMSLRNAPNASLDPTSALKTYKDGMVTISVKRNSSGTLTMLATICICCPLPVLVSENTPMHAPYTIPSTISSSETETTGSLMPSVCNVPGRVASPRRIRSSSLNTRIQAPI